MDDIKRIIEKINKLRALATSNNANEAAAAAAAAARLIEEHDISEAQLGAETDDPIMIDAEPILKGKVIAQWKCMLVNILSTHFGVYSVRDKRGSGVMTLSGRSRDIEAVRYFYTWLSGEATRLAIRSAPKAAGVGWHTTYKNGFAAGVGVKLKEMRGEARKGVEMTSAMVRLDTRGERAALAFRQTLSPTARILSSPYNWGSDPSAYKKGVEDGKNIHMGAGLPGSGDGAQRPRALRG
jgi:hypothetical protein